MFAIADTEATAAADFAGWLAPVTIDARVFQDRIGEAQAGRGRWGALACFGKLGFFVVYGFLVFGA